MNDERHDRWVAERVAVGRERGALAGSVAVAGDTAVVGAPGRRRGGHDRAGTAAVLRRTRDGWRRTATLAAATPRPSAYFGTDTATDGRTVVVGAPGDGEATTGAAVVFERRGDDWIRRRRVTGRDASTAAVDPPAGQFGSRVALGDGWAAVGAPAPTADHAGGTVTLLDAARDWRPTATRSRGGTDDRFGAALSADGDRLVVGAPTATCAGAGAGRVTLLSRTADGWRLTDGPAPAGDVDSEFGVAVAADGRRLAVGATPADRLDTDRRGSVVVYERDPAAATDGLRALRRVESRAPRATFGGAVAFGSRHLFVGAPTATVGSDGTAGAVTVLRQEGGVWRRADRVGATGEFGTSVAADGETVLVGAHRADCDGRRLAGAVFELRREG